MNTSEAIATGRVNPWRVAVLYGMASYLDAGALTGTSTALVLYAQELALSKSDIGLLSGLLTGFFALGALCGGALGDRFGRQAVFKVSLMSFLVGLVCFGLARNQVMLYAGVLVLGSTIGANLPVATTMIAESAPEHLRGKMLTLSSLLWLVGIASTAVVTALTAKLGAMGGRVIFMHLAVVAAVVMLLVYKIPESRLWMEARRRTSRSDAMSQLRLLTSPPVLGTTVALTLFLTFWNLVANTQGLFGALIFDQLLHIPLETFATLNLVCIPVALVFMGVFMKVVDGRHRGRWLFMGAVSYLLAYLIPAAIGPSFLTLAVAAPFMLFGIVFAGEGVLRIIAQELLPTMVRTTSQGVCFAFARLAAAGFAVATPSLLVGDGTQIYAVLAAFALASGLVLCVWIPRRPLAVA